MGYRPVIDCYEESGKSWTSKKEVLVWGAGAELSMRVTSMGEDVEEEWQKTSDNERTTKYDHFHHRKRWISFQDETHHDGRDDITSINLLRPWQNIADSSEHVIVGRASGELACIAIDTKNPSCKILTRFITGERYVRSGDISTTGEPLLAACLSNGTVAIYPVNPHCLNQIPHKEIDVIPPSASGQTWTTRFLSPRHLAIGIGPSEYPIHVFEVSPTGTSLAHSRKFSLSASESEDSSACLHSPTDPTTVSPTAKASSVYSISPLDTSSLSAGSSSAVFLSGWYNGSVKLHDLRSPGPHTAVYADPIDTFSPIYSLLSIGRERIVAGTARHSLMKVFDLRMPGGRVYFAANAEACAQDPPGAMPSGDCCNQHRKFPRHRLVNYNVFLEPTGAALERMIQHNAYRFGPRKMTSTQRRSQRLNSPVYALAAGAPYSPHVYAGLEGTVMQLDLVSVVDRFPDQVFGGRDWVRSRNSQESLQERFDPDGVVVNLAAMETTGMESQPLRHQKPVGSGSGGLVGWDERWR